MAAEQVIFQYLNPDVQTLTVPAGYSNQVLVYAWGAGGGDGSGAIGAGGGFAAGIVTINSGDTVILSIGSAGGSASGASAGSAGAGNNPVISFDGGAGANQSDPEDGDAGGSGGGGGATVLLVNNVPIIVAAGGGGGGGYGEDGAGGATAGTAGGVATKVNTVPRGGAGKTSGGGGSGGGGAGYPFGGATGTVYGDDQIGSQGGYGGQNYANASVASATLESGSGIAPGGLTNGLYPGASRGYRGYNGAVIVVFTKSFRSWVKDGGDWKDVNNAYVKVPETIVTGTRTVEVPVGTEIPSTTSQTRTFSTRTLWTVPPGVTRINATLKGAGGGTDATNSYSGGAGGLLSFTGLTVTPGSTLEFNVGTKGGRGVYSRNGGGGGGYSSIALSVGGTPVAIAGGGGGGGGAGPGGADGTNGGAGGGNGSGAPGATGGSSYNGNPGLGGTLSAGGLGGANINRSHGSGTAGSSLQGGAGGNDTGGQGGANNAGTPGGGAGGSAAGDGSGGGGGGGYFGGGGGSSDIWGSGGGGGSGYLNTSLATQVTSTQGGGSASDTDGSITITYSQTTYTTVVTYRTETYPVTTRSGGWKAIQRGWIKSAGKWQPIQTGVSLAPVKTDKAPISPVSINITIAGNTDNYNLATILPSTSYYPGRSIITLTVAANVVVGSTTIGTPALIIDGLTAGDTVRLVNNGTIYGRGGDGGTAGSYTTSTYGKYSYDSKGRIVYGYGYGGWSYGGNYKGYYYGYGVTTSSIPGRPGGDGGAALEVRYQTTLVNNGVIAGGGGGGGGGGGPTGGQGGGGAGYGQGANNGTLASPGAGAGLGGSGGARGTAGVAGTSSTNGGGPGGAAGPAIVNAGQVIIATAGTIIGPAS